MSYWLEIEPLVGTTDTPANHEIIVIGSGFSGVSCAYFLQQAGYRDILLLDDDCRKSASFRNCGHILPGLVESIVALQSIHGREKAETIWKFSEDCCATIRDTIEEQGLEVDYRQNGYLVVALDDTEDLELRQSVALLNEMGFEGNRYVSAQDVAKMGLSEARGARKRQRVSEASEARGARKRQRVSEASEASGARYDARGASAHPVKFRNALLRVCLERGASYHSAQSVQKVRETADGVEVSLVHGGTLHGEAVVLATNAYTALLSPYFTERIVPFRGQIIASEPLSSSLLNMPFSFNHGYEYGLFTTDNRLLLGGWREHTASGETDTYSLEINPVIEKGLKDFCQIHLGLNPRWEYSWSGIMGSSASGLPYVGTTPYSRIFVCAGFTGHGFGWAHGCAKLLQQIMQGNTNIPPIAEFLRANFY